MCTSAQELRAQAATSELALFFPDPEQRAEWSPVSEPWVYNVQEELS